MWGLYIVRYTNTYYALCFIIMMMTIMMTSIIIMMIIIITGGLLQVKFNTATAVILRFHFKNMSPHRHTLSNRNSACKLKW